MQNSTDFLCEIYVVAKELPMQKHIFMHEEGHFNVSRFQQVKLEIKCRTKGNKEKVLYLCLTMNSVHLTPYLVFNVQSCGLLH